MIWILPLALLSGVFGRMGGAGKEWHWYDWLLDTKWRDIGCTICLLLAVYLISGTFIWWVYILAGLLTFGSFTTYWDKLFGYDCFWFSGLIVGVAGLPLMWVMGDLWWLMIVRVVIVSVVWELLNRCLPQQVLCWKRDVVEEFSRYTVSL